MRPIRLRFGGLHSYREPQEIDFVTLCAGGLFGIFGPTGSGKSTILDAITLALYARVDRAGGTKQGLINEAENTMFVDFTFELGKGAACRRYQVERRYRRTNENSANVTYARLTLHTPDGTEVLADRDSDVTEAIQNILGLNIDDFTRAVVLPQGKFAAFLTMKDADRRKMLERLFGLEAYGQRLLDRIKRRLDAVKLTLAGIESAQNEQGGASPERVEEARRTAEEAARQEAAARAHLEDVRRRYDEAVTVRGWQNDLSAVQSELAPLLEQAAAMTALEETLRRAEAAEPVRRSLDEVTRAAEERRVRAERLADAERRLAEAVAQHEAAAQALTQARTLRQESEPGLVAQRTRLEQAVRDEAALRDKRQEQAGLAAQHEALAKSRDEVARQLQETAARLADTEKQIREAEARQRELYVDPAVRKRVDEAFRALDRVERARILCEQRRRALSEAELLLREALNKERRSEAAASELRSRLQSLEAELERLEGEPPVDEATLRADIQFLARMEALIAQVGQAETDLRSAEEELAAARSAAEAAAKRHAEASAAREAAAASFEAARRELEAAQESLTRAEAANRAAALAATLRPGAPCPVCGAMHHPAPAAPVDLSGEQRRVQEAQAQLKACEDRLREAERHAAAAERDAAQTADAVQSKEQQVAARRARCAELRSALPSAWQEMPLDALRRSLEAERANLERRQREADAWQAEAGRLRKEIGSLRRALDEAAGAAAQAASARAECAERQRLAAAALQEAERELAESEAAFATAACGADAAAVRAQAQAIEEADRALKALQDELGRLNERAQQDRAAVQELTLRQNELAVEAQRLVGALERLAAEIADFEQRIAAITGGRQAGELLAEVQQELQALQQRELELARVAEAAEQDLRESERSLAAARESSIEAERRLEQAQRRLEAELAQRGFASAEEAAAALRSDDERRTMKERLEAYHNQVRLLTARREELERLLGGRWIDDAAWERLQDEYRSAQEAHHAALQRQSVAARDYAALQEKLARWQELEKHRVQEQAQKDRLEQLQILCRGNQFVEFVAQEYLEAVAVNASVRLASLTRNRYALAVDSAGGFVVRDHANGGVHRPVSSLSGGEVFVTSLALALALSSQIQLHGTHPLEFFFLDEGFGTLDRELLDTVITSLERLQSEHISIGVISHVPELRDRVSRRLIVVPAADGRGSRVYYERA